jgi:hypothetical protein
MAATPTNGLPHGTMGRIAFDWSRSNPKVIYAQIEVAPDKEPKDPAAEAAAAAAGGGGRGGGGGGGGQGGGRGNQPPNPQTNGIWRSMDGGKTWEFRSNENQRPMYFSQIRVDPNNPDVVYVGGVNSQKSIDGAQLQRIESNKGHVDNHAIWIDPNNSQHVILAMTAASTCLGRRIGKSPRPWGAGFLHARSTCGIRTVCTACRTTAPVRACSTRTGGIHMWNWISVVAATGSSQRSTRPIRVFYTESQNGSISRYDLNTGETRSVRPQPAGGGRGGGGGGAAGAGAAGGGAASGGGGQGGGGGRGNVVGPDDDWVRVNWNTPIRISPHNSSTLLIGGTRLYISRDRGQTYTMSAPLGKKIDPGTRTLLEQPYNLPNCGPQNPGVKCILSKNDGYVANEYGTIIEIAESPVAPGVLWVGTNDGNLQMSKDGGFTWAEVGKNIPGGGTREYYVSGLEASWYDPGTAYARSTATTR